MSTGSALIEVQRQARYSGTTGMDRLLGGETGEVRSRLSAVDPASFRALHQHVDIDGIGVDSVRMTPVIGEVVHQPVAQGDALVFAVASGRIRYRHEGEHHHGGSGSVHLLHVGGVVEFELLEPTHLIRIAVPIDRVPLRLRDPRTPLRPLQAKTLSLAFIGFIRQFVQPDVPETIESTHLVRAMQELTVALFEEALPAGGTPDELRQRILWFVEQHLGDHGLGPRTIADEFGISLRWVHHIFSAGGSSLAKHIRDRRVDSVAEVLRSDQRTARVAELGDRFGFAGRDQLTRAFKARYGVTIGRYQEIVSAGGRPPAAG